MQQDPHKFHPGGIQHSSQQTADRAMGLLLGQLVGLTIVRLIRRYSTSRGY